MRKKSSGIMIGMVAALLLLLSAADCDNPPSGDRPQQHPPAAGNKPAPQNPAQPAPVQGDPHAHNTQPGYVGLFLTWEAESRATPVCEWTRNGTVQPCNNMESPTHEGATWIGLWEHEELAKTGDRYTLTAQGTGAVKTVTCEIAWKGQIIPGVTRGGRCGVSYQLN